MQMDNGACWWIGVNRGDRETREVRGVWVGFREAGGGMASGGGTWEVLDGTRGLAG